MGAAGSEVSRPSQSPRQAGRGLKFGVEGCRGSRGIAVSSLTGSDVSPG